MSSTADFEQLYMSSVENIKVMLSQEFKINDPHPFQLYAIFILTFILGKLLVVQKTGAGKSLIIYGALRLLGGVAIVVEPLIAVASDQTIAAITRCPKCFKPIDVGSLDTAGREQLIKRLQQIKKRSQKDMIILYVSPQHLGETWLLPELDRLFQVGAVSLVGIDEMHKYPRDGHSYRPEFLTLSSLLFKKIFDCSYPVAVVTMTATLTQKTKIAFEKLFLPLKWTHISWGDCGRFDLPLQRSVKCQTTAKIKSLVVAEAVNWKVIVYGNDKSRIKSNLPVSISKEMKKKQIAGDVIGFTGDLANTLKNFYIKSFAEPNPTGIMNLVVLCATSAANCGIDCSLCGCVIMDGLPANIEDLMQMMGRIRPKVNPPQPLMVHFVISVGSLVFLLKRIASMSDGDVDNKSKLKYDKIKKIQRYECLEVLKLLILSKTCIHHQLALKFNNPVAVSFGSMAHCNGNCWNCNTPATILMKIDHKAVITKLGVYFQIDSNYNALDIPKQLIKYKHLIWPGCVVRYEHAHHLVLQMVAAGIFSINMSHHSKDNRVIHQVNFKWTVLDGYGFAYSKDEYWKDIDHL